MAAVGRWGGRCGLVFAVGGGRCDEVVDHSDSVLYLVLLSSSSLVAHHSALLVASA